MTYQRYTFTTYQRECDIVNEYNPNIKKTKNGQPKTAMHANRPMKRLPVPNTPTPPTIHHQIQASVSRSVDDDLSERSPSPQTPGDELDIKIDIKSMGISAKRGRLRAGTIDIGYLPTKKLDIEDWIIEVKMVIQKKCLDLLLKWIDNYWIEDFDKNEKNHEEIIEILSQFISDVKKSRDQFQGLDGNKKKKSKKKKV